MGENVINRWMFLPAPVKFLHASLFLHPSNFFMHPNQIGFLFPVCFEKKISENTHSSHPEKKNLMGVGAGRNTLLWKQTHYFPNINALKVNVR